MFQKWQLVGIVKVINQQFYKVGLVCGKAGGKRKGCLDKFLGGSEDLFQTFSFLYTFP